MTGTSFAKVGVALLLGIGLVFGVPALAGAASPDLQVSPNVLEIGAFFRGGQITVTGKIPQGAQAVMEVVGPNTEEHLMRQGRRGGLWMNVGEIDVSGAPSLYLAASTDPQLLKAPPAETATWGYPALKKHIGLRGMVAKGEEEMFLGQFFQLKESEEIYASFPGAIKAAGAVGDRQTVTATFPVPTRVKPGEYQVRLTVVANGLAAGQADADLKVAMVGFPAMLASLAYQHGATYGILAVIIAIITGFAMGYLFKGGGGH
jgi:hypothetical protein